MAKRVFNHQEAQCSCKGRAVHMPRQSCLGCGHTDRPPPFFQNTKTQNRILPSYGRVGQNVYLTGIIHRRSCTHRCLEITSTMRRCFLVTSSMSRHIKENETTNKNHSFHMKRNKNRPLKQEKNFSFHLGKKRLIPITNKRWGAEIRGHLYVHGVQRDLEQIVNKIVADRAKGVLVATGLSSGNPHGEVL